MLWVTEWNDGAIKLYRRFGFEVIDRVWDAGKHVWKLRMATHAGSSVELGSMDVRGPKLATTPTL